ncbi:hypothetical protein CPB86DRAFT_822972 [Serendipita vermifera]|nr:hypothetical protein CPB86DRAFT_822972 [Serendipita vermifera]
MAQQNSLHRDGSVSTPHDLQDRPSSSNQIPSQAVQAFESYFLQEQFPKIVQVKQWAQEFGLKEDSIWSWFKSRRQQRSAGAVGSSRGAHDDVGDEIELMAAQEAFPHLPEVQRTSLYYAFKRSRSNKKFLEWTAMKNGLSLEVVTEFGKWMTLRELQRYDQTTSQEAPVASTSASVQHPLPVTSTSRHTPINDPPITPHMPDRQASMPASAHNRAISVKREHDMVDPAASLPTPRQSVGISPSTSRTHSLEPEFTETLFYDVWMTSCRNHPTPNLTMNGNVPTHEILQTLLPPLLNMN